MKNKYTILLICTLTLLPFKVSAIDIFANKGGYATANDTILLKVYINTEGVEINSIDGTIIINKPEIVKNILVGGSIFSLWPNKPSLLKNEISFAGGSTAGVSGPSLHLFTIAVKPENAGDIILSVKKANVYKNDGKGTSVPVPVKDIKVSVDNASTNTTDSLAGLIGSDKNAPKKFDVEVGHDPSVFDDKHFLSFNTTDEDSGIDYYEVTEEGFETVRSGSPYILRDQALKSKVIVKAYDKAGNTREALFDPGAQKGARNLIIAVILLILLRVIINLIRRKNV